MRRKSKELTWLIKTLAIRKHYGRDYAPLPSGLASATAASNSAHEIDPSPSASSLLTTAPIFAIAASPLPPTSCMASSVPNCLLALNFATRAGLLTCVCKIGARLERY